MGTETLQHILRWLLLVLALVGVAGCTEFSKMDSHFDYIDQHVIDNPKIKKDFMQIRSVSLHYSYVGVANKAIVVWLHGTPGSWADFGRLMLDDSFASNKLLVSLDRPGWGKSLDSSRDRAFSKFSEQKAYILPLIKKLKQDYPDVPMILAGHSWGASLAPAIAAEARQLIDGMVLFAGAYSVELSRPRWYHRVATVWPVNWMIGSELRRSNKEMFALPDGLRALEDKWSLLSNMPVIVVQGDKDLLVSPENADYIKQVLSSNTLLVEVDKNFGHLWNMLRVEAVGRCIDALIDKQFSTCSSAVNNVREG